MTINNNKNAKDNNHFLAKFIMYGIIGVLVYLYFTVVNYSKEQFNRISFTAKATIIQKKYNDTDTVTVIVAYPFFNRVHFASFEALKEFDAKVGDTCFFRIPIHCTNNIKFWIPNQTAK